jgi:hypothetical protein
MNENERKELTIDLGLKTIDELKELLVELAALGKDTGFVIHCQANLSAGSNPLLGTLAEQDQQPQ